MEVIIDIIWFIYELVFEIIMVWTGEIILYLVTLGRHRPRWDQYTSESGGRFAVFSEISFWVGLIFWIAIVSLIVSILVPAPGAELDYVEEGMILFIRDAVRL